MKLRYTHHVSCIVSHTASNNTASNKTSGVFIIHNNIKKYENYEDVKNLTEFIQSENNFQDIIITNILSFKQ